MKKEVTKGSRNVFADLGFDKPEEMRIRAWLTHQIYQIIKNRGLTQKEAGQLLGLKQPDVSDLMNGKFMDFSVDRLLNLLVRLNQEVEIIIRPVPDGAGKAEIRVTAM